MQQAASEAVCFCSPLPSLLLSPSPQTFSLLSLPIPSPFVFASQLLQQMSKKSESAHEALLEGRQPPVWRLSLRYKGTMVDVPVLSTDTALAVFEFVSSVFDYEVDLVKLIHKGKRLLPTDRINTKVTDGARLMLLASTRSQVEEVVRSRSDPTIRGFGDDDGKKQKQSVSEVEWGTEQHNQYKFCRFQPLDYSGLVPHAYEADALLRKLASDPGIINVMTGYKWTVRIKIYRSMKQIKSVC